MKSLYRQQNALNAGYTDHLHTIIALDMELWHALLAESVFGNRKCSKVYGSLQSKCETVAHDFDAQYEDSLERSVVKHF